MWHLTFRFTHTQAAAMRATTPTVTTATTTTTKTIAATALLGAIKTANRTVPGPVRSAHLARLPFCLWHFERVKKVQH